MSDAQINDLKSFISTELRTSLGSLEKRLEQNIELLRADMNSGFSAIADAISSLNDTVDHHEYRITKLEQHLPC